MARIKKTKSKEVAKFGGVDELGKTQLHGHEHDVASVETQSNTKLQDDKGEGEAVIIRRFTFGMNPEEFVEQRPTKQQIFNDHLRGIEMALYADGLKVFDQVPPRLIFDVEKKQYSIFVAARPRKGYLLQERPQTLTQIANG